MNVIIHDTSKCAENYDVKQLHPVKTVTNSKGKLVLICAYCEIQMVREHETPNSTVS